MGMRDDQEDGLKRPVKVEIPLIEKLLVNGVRCMADQVLEHVQVASMRPLSAPVEAALHDFALALDQAIKDHLTKVMEDE